MVGDDENMEQCMGESESETEEEKEIGGQEGMEDVLRDGGREEEDGEGHGKNSQCARNELNSTRVMAMNKDYSCR